MTAEEHNVLMRAKDAAYASEIATLRSDLAKAREEVETWKANHAAAEEGWMKAASERDYQASLRRVAEDAIPRGIEMAKQYLRNEYGLRMEASVEMATCLSNLLNTATCQDGGGYCSICNCCHSPDSARCWGTRSRNALSRWSNCQ